MFAGLVPALVAPARAVQDCERACQEAELLAGAGRLEASEDVYLKVLGAEPGCAAAHYALGLLYLRRLDRPHEAAEHFRRHLELRPEMSIVREWREEAESLDLFRSVAARALRPAFDPHPLTVSTLAEIKPTQRTEDEKKKQDATVKPPKPGGELAVIAFRGIQGRIVAEKGGTWEIDVGSADGVVAGMTFEVTRDGVWIGVFKAATVGDRSTICTPVAGKRAGTEAGAAWEFRGGDSAAQREDVIGGGVAEEARQRKQLMGWQQEEQGLRQQLKDVQSRQRRALREYVEEPTLDALARFAQTRQKLYGEYRAWLSRFVAWEEGVAKALEAATESRHLAAYRAMLRRQRALEEQDAAWEEILLDVRTDMDSFYAERGKTLGKRREALERESEGIAVQRKTLDDRIEKAQDEQISPLQARLRADSVNRLISEFNKRVEQFRKDLEAYDEEVGRLQGELGSFAVELADIERARERWRAGDDVQELLVGRGKAVLIESLVNAGRYELLRGRNAKALRKFRYALGLEPGAEIETAARDGAELAMLRLVLRGEAVGDAGGSLTPPLRELWSVPFPGRPVGVLQSDGVRLIGFYAVAGADGVEAGKIVALERATGSLVWEMAFPGLPIGNWVLADDEVLFATTVGTLYRVGAAAGEVRSRFDLGVLGGVALERSALRPVKSGVWWLVTLRGGTDRVYGIDFAVPGDSGVFLSEGSVYDAAVLGRDLVIAGRRLRHQKSLESYLGRITWKALAKGGEVPLTAIAKGQIEWMGMLAGALVVNVVAEGKDRESFLMLASEDPRHGSRLYVGDGDAVAGAAEYGGRLYVLYRDGALKALDVASKSLLWSAELSLPDDEEDVRGGSVLHAGEDGVIVLVGGTEPPWNISALDPEGLVLATERINRGVAAALAFADGRVFAAEYDGSPYSVGLTAGPDWAPSREQTTTLMLPGPLRTTASSEHDALLAASPAGEERVLFWRGSSPDGPERSSPLLLEADRLFVRSPLDSRLKAYAGGGRP